MQEISALLSNFNQSIQDEAKDRKYRFVVKRLMKEHQRTGDTLDEELDFYRDDDDVAVLFTMPDESHCWALGNIEEVAVAAATVNKNTAMGARGASYLLGLDKTYKPQGVFVDDPKGLFIVRCVLHIGMPRWRSTGTSCPTHDTRTRCVPAIK